MKRLFLVSILLGVFASVSAQTPQESYIERYSSIAVAEMQRTGVPASITLAQGIVESASGSSELAREANNHFGIKCHSDWQGFRFFQDDDAIGECFRAYESPEQSFRAHSDFLKERSRYASLFELSPTDYRGWAKGLSKAGYATDPNYASKLIKVINDYKLYTFDELSVRQTAAAPQEQLKASFRESFEFPMSRPMVYERRARAVISLPGETYESIAASYHLFKKEILRFNGLRQNKPLEPGTLVFVSRPKKQK